MGTQMEGCTSVAQCQSAGGNDDAAPAATALSWRSLIGSDQWGSFSVRTHFHKACWSALSSLGHRKHLASVFPGSLCFYDKAWHPGVQGRIALTLDDAPCSRPDACNSMVPQVL